MSIKLLPGPVGAEITDMDLRNKLNAKQISELTELAAERGVLVFRDQSLTIKEQVAFSQLFGTLEQFYQQSVEGDEERHIFRVSNQGDGYHVGHYWHMDGSPWPKPTSFSTLQAIEVPLHPPTHTLFLSASAAYKALPEPLKQQLDGLHWHLKTGAKPAVVKAHPVSGHALLTLPFRFPTRYDNSLSTRQAMETMNRDIQPRIAGLSEEEQTTLILQLIEHMTSQPQWVYHHVWQAGDLVLWDQRSVYHHATTSNARRVLHRTALKGKQPKAYRLEW